MDGTFDITVVVLCVSEMVGMALPNPGNHSFATNRAMICVLVSMLPFNAIDVDEVSFSSKAKGYWILEAICIKNSDFGRETIIPRSLLPTKSCGQKRMAGFKKYNFEI